MIYTKREQKECRYQIVCNTHSATQMPLFIANYRRELRIGANIRKKGKVKKAIKFVKRMKKLQKKAGVTLRKA